MIILQTPGILRGSFRSRLGMAGCAAVHKPTRFSVLAGDWAAIALQLLAMKRTWQEQKESRRLKKRLEHEAEYVEPAIRRETSLGINGPLRGEMDWVAADSTPTLECSIYCLLANPNS